VSAYVEKGQEDQVEGVYKYDFGCKDVETVKDVCCRMLPYAAVCCCMLPYAAVC
jgi:hypothetical protein